MVWFKKSWNIRRVVNSATDPFIMISKIMSLLSFLFSLLMPVNDLRCRVGPTGLGHFEFKPSSTEELVQKLFFKVSGWFYAACKQEPSKDHQGQVGIITTRCSSTVGNLPQGPLHATHGGVGPARLYTLRAIPGTWAQAPSQKRAQSSHSLRPHQLLDGKLAGTNNAKAASQPASPMLGMSLVRLPFCEGTAVPLEPSQKFLDKQKRDREKQLTKIKFHCTSIYVRRRKHVLNGHF